MSTSDALQPIRGRKGASDPGPRNLELDRQNPDLLISAGNGSRPLTEPEVLLLAGA